MKGTGCNTMFHHKRLEELKLMFEIYKRVPETLKYITDRMQPYIENRGTSIVQDSELQKDAIGYTQ